MTILALSFNFLWYECSRAMAMAIINRFIHNFLEYLKSNKEIQKLLERYKVADCIDDALCKRYVNKTDKGGYGSTPSLIGLCIPTTAKMPATFVPTIMKIKDNVVVKSHWKDLLHRCYFYRLLNVSLIGFKIVKNYFDKHGLVILDFNMDKVIYREYPKMLSYPSNIESGEKNYTDLDSEDSLSSLIKKKKNKLKRSRTSKSREILFQYIFLLTCYMIIFCICLHSSGEYRFSKLISSYIAHLISHNKINMTKISLF